MPACRDCVELVDGRCLAEARSKDVLGDRKRPAPLSACAIPIVEQYTKLIGGGDSILEVGSGSWSRLREHCEASGAAYEGIDGIQHSRSIATRFENLANLSFGDKTFDFVVGTQSMEHWPEYGCSLAWGLYQCFRVCKDGGTVMMNVPIHFHGHTEFMLGRLERLHAMFEMFSSDVSFEEWGQDSDPIPAYHPYRGYFPLRNRHAYVLDIRAVRNKALPEGIRNTAWKGFIGKFQTKPPSYIAYSAVCRALGVPR